MDSISGKWNWSKINCPVVYVFLTGIVFTFILVFMTNAYSNNTDQEAIKYGLLVEELNATKHNLESCQENINEVDSQKSLVAVIKQIQPRLDPKIVDIYDEAIVSAAYRWGFPPELLACKIKFESSFNPVAVSKVKAAGPSQVMLDIHKDKISARGWTKQEAMYVANNIDLGAEILREYYDQSNNIHGALTKYSGGAGNGYMNGIMECYADVTIHRDMSFPIGEEVKNQTVVKVINVTQPKTITQQFMKKEIGKNG